MDNLISEIPTGLWRWFDFAHHSSVLFIDDSDYTPIIDNVSVTHVSVAQSTQLDWLNLNQGGYDYIISVGDIEKTSRPVDIIKNWRGLLKPDGHLLLGLNNRFGLRYFCGDRDPYTGRNFDGIEGYFQAYATPSDRFNGRMYSRSEIENFLRTAGFPNFKFYSVLSDLMNPFLIFADNYLPNENIASRIFPAYNYPDTIFLTEEVLYQPIIDEGIFHHLPNAFLVDCSMSNVFSDILHVTCSIERGQTALYTIIHADRSVEKRAIYSDGVQRIRDLASNTDDLKANGVPVVEGKLDHNRYIMPFVDAEVGQVYLARLLFQDIDAFLVEFDRFRDAIISSSSIVRVDDLDGPILQRGYADLVPLNSFLIDGQFAFYDQECFIENCPLNMILTRVIRTFYFGNPSFSSRLKPDVLYERWGLLAEKNKWLKMGNDFLDSLRNDSILAKYHESVRRNSLTMSANRQRLNFSAEEYQRKFVDIFKNADTRKLILFGSGRYTERFLELYAMDYNVEAIVDNNPDSWGKELGGIEIKSPDFLRQFHPGQFKVIVCIKKYTSVVRQLDSIGISDYCIFDPNNNYPRKRRPIVSGSDTSPSLKKKYHVGYIAGVFDLFHVGHLNMFRRAKELCDYLIVGVVSDEGVRSNKKVEPFVPFEERVEMVKSCRFVDEVVPIPTTFASTRDAWKLHHFDVQFSGSDYVDDPNWLSNKEFLEARGAEMVFFPYTQSTSSTKLKGLIDQKLI